MVVFVFMLLFGAYIDGVYSSVADLQFCRGASQDVGYTVSEIYFYRFQKLVGTGVTDKPPIAKRGTDTITKQTRCVCDITPKIPLNTVTLVSKNKPIPCYDYVYVYNNISSFNHTCQSKSIAMEHQGTERLRLILYEGDKPEINYISVIPMEMRLVPTQPSLKVLCYAENVTPTSGDVFNLSTTSSSNLEAAISSTTTVPGEASPTSGSEANFTPLIIGVVALAMLAGTCVVCFVLCRTIRKTEERRNPNAPPERLHQIVHRKASNMLRTIKEKRPLPHLPSSMKRKPKFPVTVQESGLYDSIRSKTGQDGDKTKHKQIVTPQNNRRKPFVPPNVYTKHIVTPQQSSGKPVVTTQVSNDSSLYIHPINEANHVSTNGKDTPKQCGNEATDSSSNSYLTEVILHDTNTTTGKDDTIDNTDSDYILPVTDKQKTDGSSATTGSKKPKPVYETDVPNTDTPITNEKDTFYMNHKNHNAHRKAIKVDSTGSDVEYMSMSGLSDNGSQVVYTNTMPKREDQSLHNAHSLNTPGEVIDTINIDNENEKPVSNGGVFPELFQYQPFNDHRETFGSNNRESGV